MGGGAGRKGVVKRIRMQPGSGPPEGLRSRNMAVDGAPPEPEARYAPCVVVSSAQGRRAI